MTTNDDGSVDITFGPSLPDGMAKSNWIQTIDGRDLMVVIRLYGADLDFFDQIWKPDDVAKIQ